MGRLEREAALVSVLNHRPPPPIFTLPTILISSPTLQKTRSHTANVAEINLNESYVDRLLIKTLYFVLCLCAFKNGGKQRKLIYARYLVWQV